MRQQISLNDNHWLVGHVPRCPVTSAVPFDRPQVSEWLPATVPGNVRTDLLDQSRISNPFVGDNYKVSQWVDDVDWWYRRTLPLNSLAPDQRAFIIFNGIDYLSAIFLNDIQRHPHQGMFSRQILEITGAIQNGATEVGVRIWGSSALPPRQLASWQKLWKSFARQLYRSWVGIYADRTATLKTQMSFGWDFAPPIRTMGIWDDVDLVITGSILIEDFGLRSIASGPTNSPADLMITVKVDSLRSMPVETLVTLVPANFDGETIGPFQRSLDLPAGVSVFKLKMRLPKVRPWQPWERGFQHLYNVTLTLLGGDGTVIDTVIRRTGFRTVDKRAWQFEINSEPLFLRGLNWVPADSFPGRLRRTDYERLLRLARESGANLLRVWGGGLREKQIFYELCDELGLLVWQEFPFSCEFLGSFPQDRAHLTCVAHECGDIVRQLRHHPALLVWCAGNEFSQLRNRSLIGTLANVVRRHDGTRPFIPVSPSVGQGRDAHNWQVWHGEASFQAYQQEAAHFLSEFGLQALPHPDTLGAILENPDDPGSWSTHHGDANKLHRYSKLMSDQPPLPGDQTQFSALFKAFPEITVYQSQLAQAVALQTAIEHMRRRRPETGGLCIWQFNEPWPAISWALVDYFGRPKLAFHRLVAWYNPVLVSLEFPVGQPWTIGDLFQARVWLINDSLTDFRDCQLQIFLDKQVVHNQTVDVLANRAAAAGVISFRLQTRPHWLEANLTYQGEVLSRNWYPLRWSDTTTPGVGQQLRRWIARLALR